MKKKVIIIAIIILIILGLALGGYIFVKNFTEDQKKTLEVMEKIKEEYKSFSPLVEKFSEARTNFHIAKEELFFLDSINDNKDTIITMMTSYNNLVMNVHTSSAYLQENCAREYANASVNNTCNLFKQGYEAVMNYYITDIGVYNSIATEYNAWLTENSLTFEPLTLQEFTLHENYIDYDKDGSYLGGK